MNLTPDDLVALADAARCPMRFTSARGHFGWISTDKPATLLHEPRTVRRLLRAGLLKSQCADQVCITFDGRAALTRHERRRQRELPIEPALTQRAALREAQHRNRPRGAASALPAEAFGNRHQGVRAVVRALFARLTRSRA